MSSIGNSHQFEHDLDDDEYIIEMIQEAERDVARGGMGVTHEEMLAFLAERARGNCKASLPEQTIAY